MNGACTREGCLCSAISTGQQTAQVKGSTNKIVTVVATQALEPGDVLRRFKAAQDAPRRGNNNNRYSG